jgi:hypothetical protein
MIKVRNSNWIGLLRIAAISILIPLLGLLIETAHAYFHSHGSWGYFYRNADFLQIFEPGLLFVVSVESIVSFLILFFLRRFLKVVWLRCIVVLFLVLVWAMLAIIGEYQIQ